MNPKIVELQFQMAIQTGNISEKEAREAWKILRIQFNQESIEYKLLDKFFNL